MSHQHGEEKENANTDIKLRLTLPAEEKKDTPMVAMADQHHKTKQQASGIADRAKKKKKPRRLRKNINVKTLFVGGLPMDARPREIYLMFRKFTGYQGSILKMYGKEGKTATPVAFVTFETREQAETAKSELHGLRFDEQVAKTLKIEFAKSNTKDAANAISSRSTSCGTAPPQNEFRIIHPPTVPIGDRATSHSATISAQQAAQPAWPPVMPPAMFYDMSGSFFPPPPPSLPAPVYPPAAPQYPPTAPSYPPAAHLFPPVSPAYPPTLPAYPPAPSACIPATPPSAASSAYSPAISVFPTSTAVCPTPSFKPQENISIVSNSTVGEKEENSPCTTLFVANLCHQATEDELINLFSGLPSFWRVRMLHNKGMKPVAFVQYSELSSAIQAKNTLNGKVLLSAETGGVRIEYAKKDMGGLP